MRGAGALVVVLAFLPCAHLFGTLPGAAPQLLGSSERFVRLELLMAESSFDILCEKLQMLMRRGWSGL